MDNKKIFSRNLVKYIDICGKSKADISKELKVKYSTFSDWTLGKAFPRIDKLQMLADYFNVSKSDLTRREQEIPHLYRWWDELRYTRRFLDFCIR